MPPERHSAPPPRPPRDRFPAHGGGPRRGYGSFGGAGGGGREGGGPRPPFVPRPAPPPAEPVQTVRLRQGDREAEISGSAVFVRQTLEDLPSLFARLQGEAPAPSRPASISLPPPPPAAPDLEAEADLDVDDYEDEDDEEEPEPPARRPRQRHVQERDARGPAKTAAAARTTRSQERSAPAPAPTRSARNGQATLEDRVFRVLERADHPLSVAAIRRELGGETTGQQIRRILERAPDRVSANDERPAAYALR